MIQPIGYLKLHRELYHKPIWKQSTPEQKVVLLTLLAMAWFNPNEWEWKGSKFKTEPGQFITSLDSIVVDCGKGISIQNVRSSLKRFEKLGFLTNESTKTGRLITIANWALYQPKEDNPTKQPTKTQQRGNKEVTPKEEGNKDNKDNNVIKDIVDFLNLKADTNFRHTTSKTVTLINSRIKDGFNVDDFKKVITVKCNEWLNTEHSKYLRPETLFGNKFESYLNQKGEQSGFDKRNNGKPNYSEEPEGYEGLGFET